MTLIERYLNGEEQEVYEDIYELGQDAFLEHNFQQVDLVLKETCKRAAFNITIIFEELKKIDYKFGSTSLYGQDPVLPPATGIDKSWNEIKSRVSRNGYFPLSLEYFYKIAGSCNFCWDWKTYPEIPWEGADPLDIPSIPDLMEMVDVDHDRDQFVFTGDHYHKDNVSGDCYTIELTAAPSVDSLLIHDDWNIPFIEYLRISFDNCGFALADDCDYEDLDAFCNLVRPKLKKI